MMPTPARNFHGKIGHPAEFGLNGRRKPTFSR